MLAAADRLGFPILVLPRGVAFDEVMSDVFTQLVDRQSWALDVADRLHRALTAIVLEGGDLPQIAGEFAALFESAVLICSPDGRVQTTVGDRMPTRPRSPRVAAVRPVRALPHRTPARRPAATRRRGTRASSRWPR